jgi:hypothetical protein
MKNIVVIVAHHKESFIYKDDVFIPIHVGKAISSLKLPMIGDDVNDNISNLNNFYCETTAIYWAWKNLKDIDYIGLCHYRRYFINEIKTKSLKEITVLHLQRLIGFFLKNYEGTKLSGDINISDGDDLNLRLIKSTITIKKILGEKNYKLIIPTKFEYANLDNRSHFNSLGKEYIESLELIVQNNHPKFNEYLQNTLSNKTLYACNMFIMDRQNFNSYCELLFSIIDEHFKIYYNKGITHSYSRIPGYISELITDAYIHKMIKEGIKFKELGKAFLTFC